ncbi:MAG: general secretion pathway protein GspK [Nitrospirae bacterium]|nr:general secretion pathway protein GspK [Nitrospirota bacterium]
MKIQFKKSRGIALVLVLWVLVVLIVTAFSFAFTTRTETNSTLAFKNSIEEKFCSEAGIERGVMELFYRRQNLNVEGLETWRANGTLYKGTLGDCTYEVRITDESGKVDINTMPDIILKNLLLTLGFGAEEANSITDSVMDWKDADDLVRLNGAESSYYMSLSNPYKAKNADFETLEELSLVKGLTAQVLNGSGERKGIMGFLTVHSRSSMVNINAAPKEVIMAIPGMSLSVADALVNYRSAKEIQNINEVQTLLGEAYPMVALYAQGGAGDIFTITSTGVRKDGKTGYTTSATVVLKDNKHRFVYYKSPAQATQ